MMVPVTSRVAQRSFFYSEVLKSSLIVLFFSGENNQMWNINGLSGQLAYRKVNSQMEFMYSLNIY